ncbi:MAG: bifunctional adenosylcobinamide kinase/adenosylcobinamide-phosphate guanylyltransferase [Nitrospirae bacterium]|nr:bifunctional adenosylcobinamide kinase/adenosylcobinamide-phosphate guanylyltransferase [Nitrospirota bacterium]MBF0533665.1 bifunctional adenosylcobinamide kinase/adenosylcobinamide-phosphate guanylyltransferase [Nitrospirota bacterium]MBF0616684.1 bifunctional adenosylcobinamide kinase/adenosylcobinamide-phosphate guanylyltransferase [Nitrospirota bacterium]
MKIVFITGGAKSGKSTFALKTADRYGGKRAYVATAQALDDEMAWRIEAHQKERNGSWDTVEEPVNIHQSITELVTTHEVIVVDCLTLWLTNMILTEPEPAKDKIYDAFLKLTDSLTTARQTKSDGAIILVSNEVGLSIVPDNRLARLFRDYAGVLNQRVAAVSDEAYLVVSGLPLRLNS